MGAKMIMSQPSRRGLENLKPTLMMDLQRQKEKYPSYDNKKCPSGLIDISSSTNALMANEVREWVQTKEQVILGELKSSLDHSPSAGSNELVIAIADFTNDLWRPSTPVSPECVLVGNGVSALLSSLSFNICDPNEGIMLEVPNYGMFEADLTYRNDIRLVEVPTGHIEDRFSSLYAGELIDAYELAIAGAASKGINVRAILLCNPCNPLGRCYSMDTLLGIASFCSRHGIHLISDEIYALSSGSAAAGLDAFTSVLALPDSQGSMLRSIHVLSGASKDFGLSGLRLGWLVTHNELLWQAVRRLAPTTWVTGLSDRLFTALLLDRCFLNEYVIKYRQKLDEFRSWTTMQLSIVGIPFEKANSGLFIWIDLSKWTKLMDENGLYHQDNFQGRRLSPEVQLCHYLMEKGLFLQPSAAFFSEGAGRYRFVFTGHFLETLAVAFSRLRSALEELERDRRIRSP